MDFKFCNPDANSFDKEILIKSLEEWNVEYVELSSQTGYWIADTPFKNDGFEKYRNLISAFPIVKNNNTETCKDPNPFDTIHLPEWMTRNILQLIIEFYTTYVEKYTVGKNVHEWGNLYWANRSKPIEAFRIPHIDYPHGIVGNLWLSEHSAGTTGTNLYEYTGKIYGLYYDFQVDDTHPLFKRFKELSTTSRLHTWKNFNDEEANEFGFKKVGVAPSIYSKMTMYKAGTPHCPYIDPSIDFRWSHTFAFEHDVITVKDILI
jgi:hypothetical protein